ncbi:hypothetical protein [Brachyspira pulli]|uniref:hypothetical protein n=1 Tax=Brachyspira pulli TaxID=310721 RepID=UPI003004DF12
MNDKDEILKAIEEGISANMNNIREDIKKSSEEVSAKLADFNNKMSNLEAKYEALKKDFEDMKSQNQEDDNADKANNEANNSQDDKVKPLSQAEINKLAERNTIPSSPAAEDINTKENTLGDALVDYAIESKKFIKKEE